MKKVNFTANYMRGMATEVARYLVLYRCWCLDTQSLQPRAELGGQAVAEEGAPSTTGTTGTAEIATQPSHAGHVTFTPTSDLWDNGGR